jgi:hypothetical protein
MVFFHHYTVTDKDKEDPAAKKHGAHGNYEGLERFFNCGFSV